jgi:hypothetical protein
MAITQQQSFIKVRELYNNKLPITVTGDIPDELVIEQDITRKINPLTLLVNTIPQFDIQTTIQEGGEDDSLVITHKGDDSKNLSIKNLMEYINKHLNTVNQCFYVSTGPNASDTDDVAERGKNELLPYASIKKAAAVIKKLQEQTLLNEDTADVNDANVTKRPTQYTIFVKSGDYEEDNPIFLPPNTSLIGDNLRRTTIGPKNPTYDIIWVNSACYVWGFTFRGHKAGSAAIAFPLHSTYRFLNSNAYDIAYNQNGYFTNGSSDYVISPPTSKPLIAVSPYVQGCTSYASSSDMNNISINDAGTGMRIDGSLVSGKLRSMVLDSFTQVNQGGVGIHILNHGYAQLVSIFTVATTEGILCEAGGTCSVSTSNCTFGLSGLVARGMSGVVDIPPATQSKQWEKVGTPVLTGNFVTPNYDSFGNPTTTYGYTSGGDTFTINNVGGTVLNDDQVIATIPYTNLCFTVKATQGTLDDGTLGIVSDYLLENDIDPLIPSVDTTNLTSLDGTVFDYYRRPKLFHVDLAVTKSTLDQDNAYDIQLTYNTPNINITKVPRSDGSFRDFTNAYVEFYARSMIETGSHTFEYVGTGTRILSSIPNYGAVANNNNEAVFDSLYDPYDNLPGIVYYTGSNELGDFKVGPNFKIVQSTGTIEGDTFKRAIITLVTPLNIVLE